MGTLGSRTQVTWVSYVLEPSETSSKGFVALATNPANPAKTWLLFVLMKPVRLDKSGSSAQLTWVTYSLGSPSLAGF